MNIRKALLGTRRGLFLLLVLFVGSIYLIKRLLTGADTTANKQTVADNSIFIFKGVTGPSGNSVVPNAIPASWREYHYANTSAMAVLLTDTQCRWLGLAQCLTGIGVPFTFTTSVAEALQHKVVMVYPLISGKVLDEASLRALATFPGSGGTLIATNVYGGGMNEVFGYTDVKEDGIRTRMLLQKGNAATPFDSIFSDAIDKQIIFSGATDSNDFIRTVGYNQAEQPVISFDDGSGCMVYKKHGAGNAYALGIDIGNYALKYMNGRGYDAGRAYVNYYEAGVDILLRTLKQIYTTASNDAVTIGTTPYNQPLTMTITHDIDFTRSIVNAVKYAALEQSEGIKGTYFIQTKYVKDWNDDIFFNTDNIKNLQSVKNMGMEIASHSVAHSRVFSKFDMGSGAEQYPTYRPFVKEKMVTINGSILGELRVSKFLLEHFSGYDVHSFRPGHLQYPFTLPQALAATGYANSSSVTAGNVHTHLPYMLTYGRGYDAPTEIVEIPVAIEDERGLPMLQRLDSTLILARKLAKYGGVLNVLIHTDITAQKYEYEQKLITALKGKAWICTIAELGDWWRTRSKVRISVTTEKNTKKLVITNTDTKAVDGLTLHLPHNWRLKTTDSNVQQEQHAVIVKQLSGTATLLFSY